MTLSILSTMHGRRELCRVTFAYWRRLVDRGLIDRVVVVVTEPEDFALVYEFGFCPVEHANETHGDKWDAGVEWATDGMDAVMIHNSGGVVSESYINYVRATEAQWIMPHSLYTYSLCTSELWHFPFLHVSGHGMTVFRSAWEKLEGPWHGPAKAGTTDNAFVRRLKAAGATAFPVTGSLITVKGQNNITPLTELMKSEHERVPDPLRWIAGVFDEELASGLEGLNKVAL